MIDCLVGDTPPPDTLVLKPTSTDKQASTKVSHPMTLARRL